MSRELSVSSCKKLKDLNVDRDSTNAIGTCFKNKLNVLIVDDIKINRMVLSTQLKNFGVKIHEAENGKEAIELFLESPNIDLILMDKDMPIMNGPEATSKLRSMGILTKIVGLSSHSTRDAIKEFMDAGINKYYTKPMNRADLILLLREVDEEYSSPH